MIPRIALAIVSVLLVFGVAELAARLLAPDPVLLPSEMPGSLNPIGDIRKPNVEGLLAGVPFRTNSHGLRDREFGPRPAPGVVRIAVTGDSVTMGWGVDEAQAYPKRIAPLLDARRAPARHEVLNVGIAGAPIGEAIKRLEEADRDYAPDLLIYGFTANDIEGPAYRRLRPPGAWLALLADRLRFRNSPIALLRVLWPRWVELRERLRPGRITYEEELRVNYFENPEGWTAFEAQLGRLARLAGLQGSDEGLQRCAAVFIHTDLIDRIDGEHPYAGIYDKVAAAADGRGLSVIRSLPAFGKVRLSSLRVAEVDTHPGVRAHEIMAEALAEGLGRLPERCWRAATPAFRARRSESAGG